MNYEQSLDFIHSRNKFGIKLGLDATADLLDKIGNPHKKLKFVHIAGTNGKGSTTSYIADILSAKGYKVGKFISPYVHSFTERIQINNTEISQSDLAKFTTVVADAIEKHNLTPTEFEVVTAIGLAYFEAQKCDFVALEVGMGGRFDATNVIPAPEVSVITSISIDHTQYLGNTISEIAFEKCGIIKTGSRVVSYPDNHVNAFEVIKNTTLDKNVPLVVPDKNAIEILSMDIYGTEFIYNGEKYHINMLGGHQVYNAVTAIEAVKLLGIEEDYIKKGLSSTKFRGRLDVIAKKPLIIEDGAHNISGITELKKAIQTYFKGKKIILVMAMLKDKEYRECIETISSVADVLIATEPDNPRKATAQEIEEVAKKFIKSTYAEPDVNRAIKLAKSLCTDDDVICVCGSLYLLGEIDEQSLNKEDN